MRVYRKGTHQKNDPKTSDTLIGIGLALAILVGAVAFGTLIGGIIWRIL